MGKKSPKYFLPFSHGSALSTDRELKSNNNRYLNWTSNGFSNQILGFPAPVNCIVHKLRVEATIRSPIPVPTGELVSTLVLSKDCTNIYKDTVICARLSVNALVVSGCVESREVDCKDGIRVQRGDHIALKVRFNEAKEEDIKLSYNANLVVSFDDDVDDLEKSDNFNTILQNVQKGIVFPFSSGGRNRFESAPLQRFLTFGGGFHGDELFLEIDEDGCVQNLTAAMEFFNTTLLPGQSIRFTVRRSTGCNEPFVDTPLTCTLVPEIGQDNRLLTCETPCSEKVVVRKGDKISLRIEPVPLNLVITGILPGAGLVFVENNDNHHHKKKKTKEEKKCITCHKSFVPKLLPFSWIRYSTNNARRIDPNVPGYLVYGSSIETDVTFFVAPKKGLLTDLIGSYVFGDNSQIFTLGPKDSIHFTVLIARNQKLLHCDNICKDHMKKNKKKKQKSVIPNTFEPTKLNVVLKNGVFCKENCSDVVCVERGDRIALQVLWVNKSEPKTCSTIPSPPGGGGLLGEEDEVAILQRTNSGTELEEGTLSTLSTKESKDIKIENLPSTITSFSSSSCSIIAGVRAGVPSSSSTAITSSTVFIPRIIIRAGYIFH